MKMLEIWVMLVLEAMGVGSNILTKAAMAKAQGLLSNYVFVTFSCALASFFLLPFTLFPYLRSRTNLHPKITCYIIMRIFLLALVTYCYSLFLLIGLSYSSPTLASAMSNLTPAITFTIAVSLRMEDLDLRSWTTQLKVVGTLVSISGAITVTFYQGWPIIIFTSSSSPIEKYTLHLLLQTQLNWILGGFFLLAGTLCLSLMYIIKTWIARDFNSDVVVAQICVLFMTAFAALATLIAEKDYKAWLPNNHIELIAVIFSALVVSTSTVGTLWACKKKGPLFVAMFKPLEMIFAAIMGVFFLKDTLYFGSVVGGIIIALGFYTVMKGKADEEKHIEADKNRLVDKLDEVPSDDRVPLLLNKNINV